jgi:Cu+-exporting ATPase
MPDAGGLIMSNITRYALPAASGVMAAGVMLGIYFGVLTLASGWSFTLSQFEQFWPYILALAAGFGVQIGLFVHLRRIHAHHHNARHAVAVSGTASTAAMLACCTHYLANLIPMLGMAGAITLVSQLQTELFWVGLAFNAAGLAYIGAQVIRSGHHMMGGKA